MSLPSPSLAQPVEESRAPTKYVLVTGGVTVSTIGFFLQTFSGLRVTAIKIDLYLNTDGTMSPVKHGGVLPLDDGVFGYNFEHVKLYRDVYNNIITGKIYQCIIEKEIRRGDYLGNTVQVVPDVTDEIKRCIQSVMSSVPMDGQTCPADVCVIELGGIIDKDNTMVSPKDHLIPMVVLWDIENCHVPKNAQVEGISDNIRNALSMEPSIDLAKVTIRAYGFVPPLIREGLQRAEVIHIDVLNRKKNAADKMISDDMYCFALDNPPPAGILLISGDADFAPTVRNLVNRGYTIVTALPYTASSDLITAGTYAWDWPSLARGEGIVIRESLTKELGILKTEMICLFESHGGHIDVGNILSKYTKMFHKQIKLSDYNAPKLVDLFMMMGEPFSVFGTKHVFLDMEFAQGSTSATTVGPSGVPDSVTDTSPVNMEEHPYAPSDDANVETRMVWNRR